jgi:DNA-binding beta-propeller fold protein YncE
MRAFFQSDRSLLTTAHERETAKKHRPLALTRLRDMVCWVYPLLLLLSSTSPGSALPNLQPTTEKTGAPVQLSFIREFSSAEDVKGISHPILNKALDIVAGPKDPSPPPDSMLLQPHAVTTDSNRRIFVTDITGGVIHVFDFVNHEYWLLGAGSHLRSPLGITTDADGNVYVSDTSLRTVFVYDARGKFMHYLTKPRGDESYFDAPRGIAIDPATEHVYVCDTPRHMVIVLDKKGHVVTTLGKRGGGSAPGEFKNPTQVVARGGEIFVLDVGNSRVQILDPKGHLQREIPLANVDNRAGLAVDGEGKIYVTDPEIEHIQVFDYDGHLLSSFGAPGANAGQFNWISGAWVDSGHCLYVVDSQNKRVQLFETSGVRAGGCQ